MFPNRGSENLKNCQSGNGVSTKASQRPVMRQAPRRAMQIAGSVHGCKSTSVSAKSRKTLPESYKEGLLKQI